MLYTTRINMETNTQTTTEAQETVQTTATVKAVEAVQEAQALPDGKILIQKFAELLGSSQYAKNNYEISGNKFPVEAGGGIDVIARGKLPLVRDFNKNDYGGGDATLTPNKITRANELTTVDVLRLNIPGQNASDGFKQIEVTEQDILGIQNFLSGKNKDFDNFVSRFEPTITRFEFVMLVREVKRLLDLTLAKTPFDLYDSANDTVKTQYPTSRYITYNGTTGSNTIVDAIANASYIMDLMQSDNETFLIGADGTNQREVTDGTCVNVEDTSKLNIYVNPYDKRQMIAKLRNGSIRDGNISDAEQKEKAISFVERLKTIQPQVKNPFRDIIEAKMNNATYLYQLNLINDSTNPDENNYEFVELSSANPITVQATPVTSNVEFVNGQYGKYITATIGGTVYTGTFKYIQSKYDFNIIPRDTLVFIYQTDSEANGISTLFNLNIENTQDGVKNISKNKYGTIGLNVASANTTQFAIYKDPGFHKVAQIQPE